MRKYQTESSKTNLMGDNVFYHLLGLISEACELAAHINTNNVADKDILLLLKSVEQVCSSRKKDARDRGKTLNYTSSADIENMKKELGDCLWYVTQLATSLNLDIEEVEEENLKKLFARLKNNTIQGTGDNR